MKQAHEYPYRLPCLAALPYFPSFHLDSDERRAASALVYALKDGKPRPGSQLTPRDSAASVFADALGRAARTWEVSSQFPTATLVAVPSSAKTAYGERFGAGWDLAILLPSYRFGKRTAAPVLVRATAIPKAALARQERRDRPSVEQHRLSLGVVDIAALADATAIALVDDVRTKGTQLMAAALALRDAGVTKPIFALAGAFTWGYDPDGPSSGTIVWDGLSKHTSFIRDPAATTADAVPA